MRIDISKVTGWAFVIAAFVWLEVSGNLDLLVILLPLSVIMGYGLMWLKRTDSRLTSGAGKR